MHRLELDCRQDYPDFSLEVNTSLSLNGITGIFGPSGCGKTTLLRIIAGLEPGATGRVVFNEDTWQDDRRDIFIPSHRRRAGYVFQDARLFPHLTAAANLRYAARRRTGTIAWPDVVDALDLQPILERRVTTLSGGEQQRIAIGRALLAQPRLLMMDEPLSALDQLRKRDILPYLQKLPAAFHIPILYVTHSVEEIRTLAASVLLMSRGAVAGICRVEELLATDAAPALHHQGEDVANISATVTGHDTTGMQTILDMAGQEIRIGGLHGTAGESMQLSIPTRNILVSVTPPGKISVDNILTARVTEITPGHFPLKGQVHLDLAGQPITVPLSGQALERLGPREGQQVHLLLNHITPIPADVRSGGP